MEVFSVMGLTKYFGGISALESMDLLLEKGEVRGIIGPNGSGKTTLVNVVTGMLAPTKGRIYLDGEDITNLSPYLITRKGIARTFQIPKLIPEITCLENVMLGQHCKYSFDLMGTLLRLPFSRSRQEEMIREKACEALERMGLRGCADRIGEDLSWVEEQLVQMCRALICEPKLLFLDEPTAGMGESESRAVQEAIRVINGMGVTVVIIAHDMKLIMEICDYITCISFGNKIAEGTPEEVKNNPKVLEVYLGKE